MHIGFVTCDDYPQLSNGDQLLAKALEDKGVHVRPVVWTKATQLDELDLLVFRSCWDYTRRYREFLVFLDRLSESRIPVENPVATLRWNADKSYLVELAETGLLVVPSRVVRSLDEANQAVAEFGSSQLVIKPLIGNSGGGVTLLTVDEIYKHMATHTAVERWLIQPFMQEIQGGEYSLVFMSGEFSHAVLKTPQPDEFRINSAYGGNISHVHPHSRVIEQAQAVLSFLDELPLYARVDGLVTEQGFCLCELELVEPSLYFGQVPGAVNFAASKVLQAAEVHSGQLF